MTASPTTLHDYGLISIAQIVESPKNPRKHFDQAKLEELAASIREHGVITPLLVRELAAEEAGDIPTYELAAGHRRYRASRLAGLTELPVVVREMTDTQLLEVLTIENLQRDDVHELEEAQGFQDLITEARYTVERIAERIGMSTKYVYDRIKLLQLVPELRELFFAKKIQAGHAIILARLSPADQKRAQDYQHGGLWAHEDHGQTDLAELAVSHELKGFGHVQPHSVRELQRWVDRHVRFDATKVDPQLFPETAATLAPVAETKEKVVAISHSQFVHPDAKGDGARTYGPTAWKRADGKQKSKPCDRSVIGVIVVGEERGASFRVCVDKLKCKTHWGAEISAREKREKAPASGSSAAKGKTPTARPSWEIEEEKRKEAQLAFEPISKALLPALAAHIKKAPAGGRSLLAQFVVAEYNNAPSKKAEAIVGRGTSAEDLLRFMAFGMVHEEAERRYSAYRALPDSCKALGFDYPKFVKSLAPAKATPEKRKVAAKKARR